MGLQYTLTDYQDDSPIITYWEGAFNSQEIDYLQNLARNSPTEVAQVGGGNTEIQDNDVRRSNVSWLYNSNENNWIFEKLGHVISSLNATNYRYDLTGFGEAIQLTNYSASDAGMYSWHQDFGSKVSRKLSLVMQLSDPVDYEGGTLEIMTSKAPRKISKQRGLISVFPSFTVHQVTPVTEGHRQSLVCWITGPQFK